MLSSHHAPIQQALEDAVEKARRNSQGECASYIPVLARGPRESTSAAITCIDGATLIAGDAASHRFTFQSSAKLLLLAGLLEERGPVDVFKTAGAEPSGQDFAS